MAKKVLATAVVEWSPSGVSWVGAGHNLHTAPTFADAAGEINARDVMVAISRRTAFVRAYRVPNVARAEVKKILDVQIGQLFPIPATDASYDFHLTDDVDHEGRLALVVAMRSSDLELMHEQARAAGLRVVQVVPTAMGSAFLARAAGQPDAAVVHRTPEGLAIDILKGGELRYTRVAPMPVSAIAIEAEVNRTFAAALLNCCPTVAAGSIALPEADVATPDWALEHLLDRALDIDLKTPAQRLIADRVETIRRMRLSLLMFAAAVLLATAVYLNYSDKEAIARGGETRWQTKLRRLRAVRDVEQNKGAELGRMQTVLERGFRPAQRMSDVLTVASNLTPPGLWLTGFTVERGKVLALRGTAKGGDIVAQYQQALVTEPRYRDVKLVFANNSEIDKTPVVQFSISAFPVGNLPLAEPAKRGVATKK